VVNVASAETITSFSAELSSFYSDLADLSPAEVTASKVTDTSHATIKKDAIFQKKEANVIMSKAKNTLKEPAVESTRKKKKVPVMIDSLIYFLFIYLVGRKFLYCMYKFVLFTILYPFNIGYIIFYV
jgi:hypothetical protein